MYHNLLKIGPVSFLNMMKEALQNHGMPYIHSVK